LNTQGQSWSVGLKSISKFWINSVALTFNPIRGCDSYPLLFTPTCVSRLIAFNTIGVGDSG